MEIFVRIAKGGYIPGQTIDVEIMVNSKSSWSIPEFKVELLRVSIDICDS